MDLKTDICHTKFGMTVSLYYPAEHNSIVARSILERDVKEIRNWCKEKEIVGVMVARSDFFDYVAHMYCSRYSVTFAEEKYATLLRMSINASND